MGELIVLAHRRGTSTVQLEPAGDPSFYFDVACPFSYLAAEGVERFLGHVAWVPVAAAVLRKGGESQALADIRGVAERRAHEMRLSLSWPEEFQSGFPRALRAAAYATEMGVGVRFALAAMRLAFCGGFDLEDPGVISDAAAAAGLAVGPCIAAMDEPQHDDLLYDAAVELSAAGVKDVPAIELDGRWFTGEGALAEALAYRRAAMRPAAVRGLASGA